MTVHRLQRRHMPGAIVPCIERLLEAAHAGTLTGLAFVAFVDGHGYIADTCGEASTELAETRRILKQLDVKLARRQLNNR
jgi:hypothetical protein